MDDKEMRTGLRNAWILGGASAVFVVAFFLFTVRMNTPAKPAGWDMGGTAFVPASDIAADGYYRPVKPRSREGGAP